MSELQAEDETQITQTNFEEITKLVSTEFQIEEALMEHNIPTYYLKHPQETKQAFLRLLKNLEQINLLAILRRRNGRIVLKVIPKPHAKPSNIMVNWILFFATIATTFVTGYMFSENLINPIIGGTTFAIAIMAILGMHEMGHKLTANKSGIDATPPYFIPGPPPMGFFSIGTFGAVIMQRSLAPNKDSLFDIGASGPVISFILAMIATIIGLPLSHPGWVPQGTPTLPAPLIFDLLEMAFPFLMPPLQTQPPEPGYVPVIYLHPIAIAGWAGLIVTSLNLFPAAMLDGGHVSRALFGEKTRTLLTFLSVIALIYVSFPMAIFVLFMSIYRHPGPLDDVSSLSKSRKFLTVILVVILVLSSFFHYLVFALVELLRF
ncbi:MAG: site-2 protease family protein [Candidatus Bathyarchaeota archaeon]|jgi:membrane-associated protease RseP (regulator of RpoE activity)|nr:site-2 protease family protein [Candidatus Bathyarchaeota archaeon]